MNSFVTAAIIFIMMTAIISLLVHAGGVNKEFDFRLRAQDRTTSVRNVFLNKSTCEKNLLNKKVTSAPLALQQLTSADGTVLNQVGEERDQLKMISLEVILLAKLDDNMAVAQVFTGFENTAASLGNRTYQSHFTVGLQIEDDVVKSCFKTADEVDHILGGT